MKKTIYLIFAIVFILGAISCDDDNGDSVLRNTRWKLMSTENRYIGTKEDYSENNIIYEFKKHGILVVSSDIEEYRGHSPGTHTYKIIVEEGEKKISIDDSPLSMWLEFENEQLIINGSPNDGPTLYFSKN